ncbi:MAG TPA: ribonuclease G [Acidiferrobacteraceae bacterium]|nr:ribonuclease G [Acidiferrobacteraceae bacterium]
MSEEILINVTPQETRVAVVENGVLQEVHIERTSSRGLVGNLYKGTVVRILPGMQAAFVDASLERTAFLHASDIIQEGQSEDNGNGHESGEETKSIDQLLREGQDIIVQVVKDPISTKGARLTTQIAIPARNLVYLPYSNNIGVSQRIEDAQEREQLRTTVRRAMGDQIEGGYIVRTMAETVSLDEFKSDILFLNRTWAKIREQIKNSPAKSLVHEDLSLAMRFMRDLVGGRVEKVRIDSRETFQKAQKFAEELIPEVKDRIEYYPGERPIFDLHSVEDEIQKALEKKVMLKSGGFLIIDQTEAMTTVDVNTGGFVGRRNLEETLYKTNLEAAQTIARQLRLRNIGGIIIIDFIDMQEVEHQRQVMRALEKALAHDHVKTSVTTMSPLGLVEVTRKRSRESLERVLCGTCPICSGRGVLKSPQTVCYEIFRDILRESRQFDAKEYQVVASQWVVDLLLDEESESLVKLQEFIGRPIHLQVESQYHQEEFDIVLM